MAANVVMLLAYSVPRLPKQEETFAWIERNKDWLAKQGVQLDMVEVGKDRRYDAAIRARWTGDRDLLVMEHDMVPTRKMILKMLSCSEELCSNEYLLLSCRVVIRSRDATYSCEGHGLHPSTRHVGSSGDPQDWKWAQHGDEHSDFWGLGLTRFRKELMARIPPNWHYRNEGDIDSQMSVYLHPLKIRSHNHWPLCRHDGARVTYHPPWMALWNHDETEMVAKVDFAGVNVLGIAKAAQPGTP